MKMMWLTLFRVAVKSAVTLLPSKERVHVELVPVQFPVHPPKPKLVAGVAVKVT